MGRKSKTKGAYYERQFAQFLRDLGYHDAKRIPLSGASWLKGDVIAGDQTFEVKYRSRIPIINVIEKTQAAVKFVDTGLIVNKIVNPYDAIIEVENTPKYLQQWYEQAVREKARLVIKQKNSDWYEVTKE